MECQKVLQSLSSFIDGELDNSETAQIKQHLSSCPACHEEWKLLLGVTSLLHSLPEVMPEPEFHSELWSKLKINSPSPVSHTSAEQNNETQIARLTDETGLKNNIQKRKGSLLSLWRNLTAGPWSRLTACAALLVLAIGITSLWYSGNNSYQNDHSPQISMNGGTIENRNSKENTGSANTESGSADFSSSLEESKKTAAKVTEEQLPDKTSPVDTPLKEIEQNQTKQKTDSSQENGTVMRDRSRTEELPSSIAGNESTAGPRQDLTGAPSVMFQRNGESFSINSLKAEDSAASSGVDSPTAAKQAPSYEPKSISVQLKVPNTIDATAQILILSKSQKATASVENNSITITVPPQNYEQLVTQIKSLDQAENKADGINAVQESKSLMVRINEQEP
ncbi:putative transmembrane anti-sigma factor [Desulfofarcimen acetoxidans DSM 771]|uniref:Anti-sigma-W factor RsiW n=1 Tax=Desulfofarcimen acetoxidans (strain ATCC 49208 / DSM 771 / KCTC 5769 / VKM B-1644 / 5575) TaxID=485916 RepID=C8VW40_DESAS|nr:anti-sigma factor [Desulfofarcimen acetoxidans]ACV64327.1 putative transmembrane anti-sigma factor [Desulfofarcimen acetoxidans DSM 771]